MIEKLAERLTVRQIERGIIGESQKAVYKYGYIVLVEMSINVVLTLIVGILSGKMFLVISFSLIFIPLRSYCGGWHASKDWMCMLFSMGTLLVVVFMDQILFLSGYAVFLIELISFVVIFFLASMDSDSKPLDEREIKTFRNISRIILVLEFFILLGAMYFNCRLLILSIICAHGLQNISLCVHMKNGCEVIARRLVNKVFERLGELMEKLPK